MPFGELISTNQLMLQLTELVDFLDGELATEKIEDFPGAKNGLQLENSGRVDRVVSAVDASLAVIMEAASVPHTLLLVHHGLFWQGGNPIVANEFTKIRSAIQSDLAIYSSHLPLDIHPKIGNNVLLAEAVGLREITFASLDGKQDGIALGIWNKGRSALAAEVAKAVDRQVVTCFTGPEKVERVAVMTGAGGSQVYRIARFEPRIDLFLTGEGSHWSFVAAEDMNLNVIYGGHYATETFGVRSLGTLLSKQFSIPSSFIERPGGL